MQNAVSLYLNDAPICDRSIPLRPISVVPASKYDTDCSLITRSQRDTHVELIQFVDMVVWEGRAQFLVSRVLV